MGNVQRGQISTLEPPFDEGGNCKAARIIAEGRGGIITKPLAIPTALRAELKKGDSVIFVEFADRSGAIIMRTDGEL